MSSNAGKITSTSKAICTGPIKCQYNPQSAQWGISEEIIDIQLKEKSKNKIAYKQIEKKVGD